MATPFKSPWSFYIKSSFLFLLPFLLLLPSSFLPTSEIHFPRLSSPFSHTLWLLSAPYKMYVFLSNPLSTGKIKLSQMIFIYCISSPKHQPKLQIGILWVPNLDVPKVVCIQQVEIPSHFLPTTKKLISSLCQLSKGHISPKLKNLTSYLFPFPTSIQSINPTYSASEMSWQKLSTLSVLLLLLQVRPSSFQLNSCNSLISLPSQCII